MRSILYIYLNNIIMNRLIIFLTLITSASILYSQSPFPEPEEVERFYNTKTLVVLEDDMFSEYNVFIKNAVNEYWEITGHDFISEKEFDQKRKNPAYSFIVLTATRFDRDKSGAFLNFINLLLGKDVGRIEEMPEFCAVPLSIQGADDTEYSYKLGMVLRFMQAHVEHIREDPTLKGKKYLKYYNKFIPEALNKTILISENDLVPELRTSEAVDKYYPHNLKIVSDDEVDEAIRNRYENTLVLHKVGPVRAEKGGLCFKMLLGTDDARMYFYGEHRITERKSNGLLVNDLKRIGRF
ncbi:MAG TPA: hypothetical protein DEQ09_12340 [Bacteroidales bacterium]|nr:hypothetical protein [Bacteroidales bacterium]